MVSNRWVSKGIHLRNCEASGPLDSGCTTQSCTGREGIRQWMAWCWACFFVFVRLGEWCQKKKLFHSRFEKFERKGNVSRVFRDRVVLKSNIIFLPYSWFSEKIGFFSNSSLLPNTAIFHFHDYGRKSIFFPILLVCLHKDLRTDSSSSHLLSPNTKRFWPNKAPSGFFLHCCNTSF